GYTNRANPEGRCAKRLIYSGRYAKAAPCTEEPESPDRAAYFPLEKYGFFFPGQVFLLPRLPELALSNSQPNSTNAGA
ncbi:hypothetical protein ACPTG1_29930, partial [Pseudomonas aeruginosa]|uniref:hypothetical protein n=1 Tax=Pseudomonas aeruginosa TaxID=287 RepID=UPI003CC55D13